MTNQVYRGIYYKLHDIVKGSHTLCKIIPINILKIIQILLHHYIASFSRRK